MVNYWTAEPFRDGIVYRPPEGTANYKFSPTSNAVLEAALGIIVELLVVVNS